MSELGLIEMFPVNCPKTRNEEFGQLLEALTEKYCQVGTAPALAGFNLLVVGKFSHNFRLPRL